MRHNRIATSAGLGIALCVVATSAAHAEDTDAAVPSEAPSSSVTVEVVELPVTDSPTPPPPAPATGESPPPAATETPPAAPAAPAAASTAEHATDPTETEASVADASSDPGDGAEDAAPSPSADAGPVSAPSAGDTTDVNADDTADDAAAIQPSESTADSADVDIESLENDTAQQQIAAAAVISPLSAGQSVSTVADGLTPQQIVASLVGTGISVQNVVYTGHGSSLGIAGGVGAIGISNGVVLSSGSVQVTPSDKGGLVGPNEEDGYGSGLGNPGDPDLTALAEDSTYDAAVLEFDFVPTSSQLVFHYVFASEEYNEYVGSYNDVFAFFVNGVNCATIGGAPVSVNNVNNEVNSDLYVDNDPSDLGPPTPHDTEMDGFTRVLTCTASVNAGQTNHIKLAIADARDSVLDSLVIIQQGSFSSQPPPVAVGDAYSTPVGQSLVIIVPGLLGNDSQSPDGGALAAVKLTDPANGTVSLNADGSFTYVPNVGFTGIDTFTYLVTDLWGNSNIATVTINVATGEVVPDVTPVATPPGTSVVTPVHTPAGTSVVTPISVDVLSAGEKQADRSLASTGIDAAPLGAISVTLLATGVAMLLAGRRRLR